MHGPPALSFPCQVVTGRDPTKMPWKELGPGPSGTAFTMVMVTCTPVL